MSLLQAKVTLGAIRTEAWNAVSQREGTWSEGLPREGRGSGSA